MIFGHQDRRTLQRIEADIVAIRRHIERIDRLVTALCRHMGMKVEPPEPDWDPDRDR